MDQEDEEIQPLPCGYCDGEGCPMCPKHFKDLDYTPLQED